MNASSDKLSCRERSVRDSRTAVFRSDQRHVGHAMASGTLKRPLAHLTQIESTSVLCADALGAVTTAVPYKRTLGWPFVSHAFWKKLERMCVRRKPVSKSLPR